MNDDRRGHTLDGQRVVVTRARHQAGKMADAFEAAGADVEFLPLIEIVEPEDRDPLKQAVRQIAEYDWLVFTSANAVEAFLPRLEGFPAGVRVAAVGPATARSATAYGAEPRLVASRSDADGLIAELAPYLEGGESVLVPRADDARANLVEGLDELGVRVTAVEAYAKRLPADATDRARKLFERQRIGWVTFTSPRIVRHFSELFAEAWRRRRCEVRALSIGPVTTRELRRLGVGDIREASRPSPEEMVRAATAWTL